MKLAADGDPSAPIHANAPQEYEVVRVKLKCDLKIVGVLPARFGATRLPGKPLLSIAGRPLIQHVYERARGARALDRLVVATDDERIARVVAGFGGEVVMTSTGARTGSDRVAEANEKLQADVVVNLQGDEPFLDPSVVDATVGALQATPAAGLATAATPIVEAAEMLSPGVVKVLADRTGRALWFSRSPIPFVRSNWSDASDAALQAVRGRLAWRHIGIYAFRGDALRAFAAWPSSPLELAEGLEQLRAMENGMHVQVVPVTSPGGPAVDTPEDLERVRSLLERERLLARRPTMDALGETKTSAQHGAGERMIKERL